MVFGLENLEVPEGWSQVASDVLAQKYFRKAGVPAALKRVARRACRRSCGARSPDEAALARAAADERTVGERDARQVFDRLAGAWTYWGWKGGYFSTEADARAYYDEMCYMLAAQMGAPTPRSGSTPGCTGPTASTVRRRATTMSTPVTGELRVDVRLRAPQPHACFIQSVSDYLVNDEEQDAVKTT